MYHASPCLGKVIDKNHTGIEFKTRQQLEIMLRSTSKQWITGPAGSGKTWILIEKVKILTQKIVDLQSHEKVLVVCYNKPLSKMLKKTFHTELSNLLKYDVRSVVEVKTYDKLLCDITGEWTDTEQEKMEAVAVALQTVICDGSFRKYDHIFIDEGQDLYGEQWPELFQHLLKSPSGASNSVEQPKHLWVMYDTNQHLHLSDKGHHHHLQNIKGSFELFKVLRNTGNIFDQMRKYFTSVEATASQIEIGHKEVGMAIRMQCSLSNENATVADGAKFVSDHILRLLESNVEERDICVLVENQNVRDSLISAFEEGSQIKCQNAEELVEKNDKRIVVESVRRFKGLESKVVILYNPRFYKDETWSAKKVRELLYTAVSRCFCYLIVITTKAGVKALKSDQGFKESTSQQTTGDLKLVHRSQEGAFFEQPCCGKFGMFESEPPESPYKRPLPNDADSEEGCVNEDKSEDDSDSAHASVEEKKPRMEEFTVLNQQPMQRSNPFLSTKPRPMEVNESCGLIEPGDPYIMDSIRRREFNPLVELVQQNLQYIPGSSSIHLSNLDPTNVAAEIEHEVFSRRKSERNSRNYSKDVRTLKKEINDCNRNQKGNMTVMNTWQR